MVGILIEQGIESIGNNRKAVDVKMISIKRIQNLLDNVRIQYLSIKYAELQDELRKMCDYLVYITASESKLDDDMIHQGVMPESAGYMYNLQRELIKLA